MTTMGTNIHPGLTTSVHTVVLHGEYHYMGNKLLFLVDGKQTLILSIHS